MRINKIYIAAGLLCFGWLLGPVNMNAASKETAFYVSPTGDDGARGTVKHPLRTLGAAASIAAGYMQDHPGADVTIYLDKGRYRVQKQIVLKDLDGKLTITSAGNGDPYIVGDKPVKGWTLLTDAEVLARMPQEAHGKVYVADLAACGINNLGKVIDRSNRVDLYCNDKRQTPARWPNTELAEAGKALGATDLEDTWIHVHGTVEGVVEYPDSRVEKWGEEKDPYIFAYWYWDWADGYDKLTAIDKERHAMVMSKPWHGYGYRDGMRFYGLNLLCELDAPGEYYIDRGKSLVYWYAPENLDIAKCWTSLSVFAGEYMIKASDCNSLTIKGISFRGGRRGAVSVIGGRDVAIRDCRFSCFGDTPINIDGGTGHKVQGCWLEELGCAGIEIKGGDRKNLIACNHVVENTVVDNFSLFKRTYEPAVHVSGIGITVSHCLFQNSSSSAMRLDGNDITIEYCQCFDLVKESDDQGGSDTWFDYSFRNIVFRFNHWRDIKGGMYAGAAGIRFDDIISGNFVYGNVFERCGGSHFGCININGGRDNRISNNVIYDCPAGVTGALANGDDWRRMMDSNMDKLNAVDALGPVYELHYPELKASFYSENGVNYMYDNLLVKVPTVTNMPQFMVMHNNTEVNEDVKGLKYYLQASVLEAAGMRPIPFDQIGVQSNRFLK